MPKASAGITRPPASQAGRGDAPSQQHNECQPPGVSAPGGGSPIYAEACTHVVRAEATISMESLILAQDERWRRA